MQRRLAGCPNEGPKRQRGNTNTNPTRQRGTFIPYFASLARRVGVVGSGWHFTKPILGVVSPVQFTCHAHVGTPEQRSTLANPNNYDYRANLLLVQFSIFRSQNPPVAVAESLLFIAGKIHRLRKPCCRPIFFQRPPSNSSILVRWSLDHCSTYGQLQDPKLSPTLRTDAVSKRNRAKADEPRVVSCRTGILFYHDLADRRTNSGDRPPQGTERIEGHSSKINTPSRARTSATVSLETVPIRVAFLARQFRLLTWSAPMTPVTGEPFGKGTSNG